MKTKSQKKSKLKHFNIRLTATCDVLVKNAKNAEEAISEAQGYASCGDFEVFEAEVDSELTDKDQLECFERHADLQLDLDQQ